MKELNRVLIMAGGTGGHVFPGLAVAKYLRAKGVEVHWLGTSQGIESRIVPAAKFPLHLVKVSGLRGKSIKHILSAPIKILFAILQSQRIIKSIAPDVVIGMGGFVSGPGGVASWLMHRPLIIHEQNAKAGMTNKLLATVAKKILTGFPAVFPAKSKVLTVGNPVRSEIENLPAPAQHFATINKPLHLLVIGGSLGAQSLNQVVPQALAKLTEQERPIVWHQTGDKLFDQAKKAYESSGITAKLVPFIDDMADVYAWADVVLCRAGALTVAELCAAGLGAIFVPFPFAVDDHQTANANFMVQNQAAISVPQAELNAERLANLLREFSCSPEKRLHMAQAAYQLRQIKVAEKIFDILSDAINE